MATYVVLYRFTESGAKNIRSTVQRARQTRIDNEKRGFKILNVHWTQGPYDMVALVDAPSEEAMMGAMANIVSAGNVTSTTLRAFNEREMDGILKRSATGSTRAAAASTRKRAPARKKAVRRKK